MSRPGRSAKPTAKQRSRAVITLARNSLAAALASTSDSRIEPEMSSSRPSVSGRSRTRSKRASFCAPAVVEHLEGALVEPVRQPPVAVGDGRVELDQLDLDLLHEIGGVEHAEVLDRGAVVVGGGDGEVGEAAAGRNVERRLPGRLRQAGDHRVVELELDLLHPPPLGDHHRGARAHRPGHPLAARRLEQADARLALGLVEQHLVGGEPRAARVEALGAHDRLPGEVGQAQLGGPRRRRAGELGLAVEREDDLANAFAGDDHLGAEEPEDDVLDRRQQDQAVALPEPGQAEVLTEDRSRRHRLGLGHRLLGDGEAPFEPGRAPARLVAHLEAGDEALARPQGAIDQQHHGRAGGRRREDEAVAELLEDAVRPVDRARDRDPDLAAAAGGDRLEARLRRQVEADPRHQSLVPPGREGDADGRLGQLRRARGSRRGEHPAHPGREVGRRRQQRIGVGVAHPLALEAEQPGDAGDAIDVAGVLAEGEVGAPAADAPAQLLELFEQVLHLVGVEDALGVGRAPEAVMAPHRRPVEHGPARRLAVAPAPELERAVGLGALHLAPLVGRTEQELEAAAVVERRQARLRDLAHAPVDRRGEVARRGVRRRVAGQERAHPLPAPGGVRGGEREAVRGRQQQARALLEEAAGALVLHAFGGERRRSQGESGEAGEGGEKGAAGHGQDPQASSVPGILEWAPRWPLPSSRDRSRPGRRGDTVQGFALARRRDLRQDKSGRDYLDLELADASGAIAAKAWSDSAALAQSFAAHDYVKFRGQVQSYRSSSSSSSTTAGGWSRPTARTVSTRPCSSRPPGRTSTTLWLRLEGLLEAHLTRPGRPPPGRRDARRPRRALRVHPAAKAIHHAFRGGLLEHVVSMLGLAVRIADHYPELDRDLVVLGVLFHDLGKLLELGAMPVNDYTPVGRLVGPHHPRPRPAARARRGDRGVPRGAPPPARAPRALPPGQEGVRLAGRADDPRGHRPAHGRRPRQRSSPCCAA